MLVGADENSAVAQDELFGPVLVVLPHDGDDDAVRIANNSIFGLSGAVMSARPRARARRRAADPRRHDERQRRRLLRRPTRRSAGTSSRGSGARWARPGSTSSSSARRSPNRREPASEQPRFRVVQWATGNIGSRALREVIRHPSLDLVGVLVYDPEKDGVDAGLLCGEEAVGVAATTDRGRDPRAGGGLRAVHAARARPRRRRRAARVGHERRDDTRRVLRRAGSASRDDDRARVLDACRAAARRSTRRGAARASSPTRSRSRCCRCSAASSRSRSTSSPNLSRRDSPHLLFELMGFGRPVTSFTPERSAYLLGEFGPPLGLLAEAAGRPVDAWTCTGEVAAARADHDASPPASCRPERSPRSAPRSSARSDGDDVVRFSVNWYCTTDVEPAWDLRPTGWRVRVRGDAPFDVELPFPIPLEELGSFTPAYTANRPVNAIPVRVQRAHPGILVTADLPPITPAGPRHGLSSPTAVTDGGTAGPASPPCRAGTASRPEHRARAA